MSDDGMKAGPGLRKPGLYARAQGVEYELLSIKGRWVLMSHSPAPGFTKLKTEKNATARYVHEITPDAQIDTYRLSYDGTYRGVDVQVYPQADTLMVVAKDPSSRARFRELRPGPVDEVLPSERSPVAVHGHAHPGGRALAAALRGAHREQCGH